MWGRHHVGMPVGVIDVGSNTVRVLVVRDGREVTSQREMLRLGASVERYGRITPDKLAETSEVVARFADLARDAGADDIEILITSPGRQAENGADLLDVLARAGRCDARILSAREEGLLAFKGRSRSPRRRTAGVSPSSTSAAVRHRSSSARGAPGQSGRRRSTSARSG